MDTVGWKKALWIGYILAVVLAVSTTGCTETSAANQDDIKFLDIAQESGDNILKTYEGIQSALSARDWPAMKEYSNRQLTQADQAILDIQMLDVTEKRIPAKEVWLQVLEDAKTIAVYTGMAATAYDEGDLGKGNDEMMKALDAMDDLNEHLDQFNSLDLA